MMYTVELLIDTTKYDRRELANRFFALAHVHNVCVSHTKKLINSLKTNKKYQNALTEYIKLNESKPSTKSDKEKKQKRKKELSDIMNQIRYEIGLTKTGLESYMKVCGSQFSKMLASSQVQKEVDNVWNGVQKVLFSTGKTIHYKKVRDFNTLPSKSLKNGIKFDKNTYTIEYLGLNLKCKISKYNLEDVYLFESLENKISYCEIKRRMFNNGWHYYALIYVKGEPPKRNITSKGSTMGMDPSISTVAGYSETKTVLNELAPKCKNYNRKIAKIQKKREYSKRITNPKKYNEDGTIKKKNKDKWIYSKRYCMLRNKLKTLYRQKSEYTTHSHRTQVNEIVKDSLFFIIEDMNFNALKKKGKKKPVETKDSTNKENVNNKKETNTTFENNDKQIKSNNNKNKCKRFGKTINDRSPARFLKLLDEKVKQMDGKIVYVNPITYKGSQYNHDTDTYIKTPLSQREKIIDGQKVQRDLYSAFLYHNADISFKHADRDKCIAEFDNFIKLQNKLIADMKAKKISYKNCFGF